jgi:hypothetical protein
MKHYEVLELVRASSLSATQRSVLLEVSYAARGEEGECWEGQDTIGANTGLAVRTVRRDLSELVELGVLVVVPDTSRRTTTYRVDASRIPARGAATPAQDAGPPAQDAAHLAPDPAPRASQTGTDCQGTRHHVPVRPAPRAAYTRREPIPESIPEARDARAREAPQRRGEGVIPASSAGPPARASPRFTVASLLDPPTPTAFGEPT